MIKFLRGLFSEANDKPSFARVFPGLIIATVLALVAFVTIKDGKLPDLAGPTLLIGGAAGLYASNKVATAIETKAP